jgi:3-dehydroquinate synthase
VGLALDILCARDLGLFGKDEAERTLNLLVALGFRIYAPEMHLDGGAPMLAGLEEFREHLGGASHARPAHRHRQIHAGPRDGRLRGP